jgi:hypothetical protein
MANPPNRYYKRKQEHSLWYQVLVENMRQAVTRKIKKSHHGSGHISHPVKS